MTTIVDSKNNNKNFRGTVGKVHTVTMAVTASIPSKEGFMFARDTGTGLMRLALPADEVLYILAQPIATTDADYAISGKIKAFSRPADLEEELTFTTSAAFVAGDVGKLVAIDATSGGLNTAAAVAFATAQAEITEFVTATEGRCRLVR